MNPQEKAEITLATLNFLADRLRDKEGHADLIDVMEIWSGMALEIVEEAISMNGMDCKDTFESYMRVTFNEAMKVFEG